MDLQKRTSVYAVTSTSALSEREIPVFSPYRCMDALTFPPFFQTDFFYSMVFTNAWTRPLTHALTRMVICGVSIEGRCFVDRKVLLDPQKLYTEYCSEGVP